MQLLKKLYIGVLLSTFILITSHSAIADVEANVWVEVRLLQVQTGAANGAQDTRLLCTATNGSFENTWLIVDSSAANLVAAGALTAYTLQHDVVVRIVAYGTGFRVKNIRIIQPTD